MISGRTGLLSIHCLHCEIFCPLITTDVGNQRFDTELEIRSLSYPDTFAEELASSLVAVQNRKSEHFSHKCSTPLGSINVQFFIDAFQKPIDVLEWPQSTTSFCTLPSNYKETFE